MKIKCEYCGNFISDTDERCPNCGAANEHLVRSAEGIPKTIEELRAFCESHNMPLQQMRFYLGEDFKEPRAFGIYQEEDGDFVVYKNKADGSRTVRYRDKDQSYAVNELYQKLKSEVQQRREQSPPPVSRSAAGKLKKSGFKLGCLVALGIVVLAMVIAKVVWAKAIREMPNGGYYQYNDTCYYNTYNGWYEFDNASQSWRPTQADPSLVDNYGEYWLDYGYSDDYNVEDFSQSEYYAGSDTSQDSAAEEEDNNSWDSGWDDSDWDFDYDSWDSGDTSWDSDW